MKTSTHYNVRVIENEKGVLTVGFVHVAKKKSDCVEWVDVSLKEKRALTQRLIPAEVKDNSVPGMVDIQGPIDSSKDKPVVQIAIGANGDEIWVNVGSVCKFRAKKVEVEVELNGRKNLLYRTRR